MNGMFSLQLIAYMDIKPKNIKIIDFENENTTFDYAPLKSHDF